MNLSTFLFAKLNLETNVGNFGILGRFRTSAPKFHFPISSLFFYLSGAGSNLVAAIKGGGRPTRLLPHAKMLLIPMKLLLVTAHSA